MKHTASLTSVLSLAVGLAATSVSAQDNEPTIVGERSPLAYAAEHIPDIADQCVPSNWTSNDCLREVAESNTDMARIYIAQLLTSGRPGWSIDVTADCAEAGHIAFVPNSPLVNRESFAICANVISDARDATGIEPALLSNYEAMVGAVQCIDGDSSCDTYYNPALLRQQERLADICFGFAEWDGNRGQAACNQSATTQLIALYNTVQGEVQDASLPLATRQAAMDVIVQGCMEPLQQTFGLPMERSLDQVTDLVTERSGACLEAFEEASTILNIQLAPSDRAAFEQFMNFEN